MEDQTKSKLISSKIKLDNKKDESSEEEQQNKKIDCDLDVEDFVTKVCHFFVRLADASSSQQRNIAHRSDEWFWMDIAAMKLFLVVHCQVNIELKIYNLFENFNFVYRAKFEHFLNTIYGENDKKFTCHKIGRSVKAGTITALIQLGKKDERYLGCELCLDKNSIQKITLFFTSFFQAQFKEKLSEGYTTMNHAAALKILNKTAERTAVCFTNHVGIGLEIRGVLKKVILISSVDYQTIKKMLSGNDVKSEMVSHKKTKERRAPPILREEDEVEFFSTSELWAAWSKFKSIKCNADDLQSGLKIKFEQKKKRLEEWEKRRWEENKIEKELKEAIKSTNIPPRLQETSLATESKARKTLASIGLSLEETPGCS